MGDTDDNDDIETDDDEIDTDDTDDESENEDKNENENNKINKETNEKEDIEVSNYLTEKNLAANCSSKLNSSRSSTSLSCTTKDGSSSTISRDSLKRSNS